MNLYGSRKRQRDFAESEAAGEDVFSAELTKRARGRIARAAEELLFEHSYSYAASRVSAEEGLPRGAIGEHFDGVDAALRGGSHHVSCSLVEALISARDHHPRPDYGYTYGLDQQGPDDLVVHDFYAMFEKRVGKILRDERIAMRLVEGQLIDFSSEELHEGVVAPTLRLLGGKVGWDNVEAAYRNALDEIGADAGDAITDAATALQEALVLLGAEGNALGPLGRSAVKRDIIRPQDRKLIDWVSAHRGSEGDSHNADPASPEDAWLAVHVVGAVILRLSEEQSTRP